MDDSPLTQLAQICSNIGIDVQPQDHHNHHNTPTKHLNSSNHRSTTPASTNQNSAKTNHSVTNSNSSSPLTNGGLRGSGSLSCGRHHSHNHNQQSPSVGGKLPQLASAGHRQQHSPSQLMSTSPIASQQAQSPQLHNPLNPQLQAQSPQLQAQHLQNHTQRNQAQQQQYNQLMANAQQQYNRLMADAQQQQFASLLLAYQQHQRQMMAAVGAHPPYCHCPTCIYMKSIMGHLR